LESPSVPGEMLGPSAPADIRLRSAFWPEGFIGSINEKRLGPVRTRPIRSRKSNDVGASCPSLVKVSVQRYDAGAWLRTKTKEKHALRFAAMPGDRERVGLEPGLRCSRQGWLPPGNDVTLGEDGCLRMLVLCAKPSWKACRRYKAVSQLISRRPW
jgi:hypothetical protein